MLHGARCGFPILMHSRPHSLADDPALVLTTAVADPGWDAPPRQPARTTSMATRKASAPYAEKTRGYYHTLSATSVGLELAIAVVVPLLFGIWLDKKAGTSPWLMLLCLGFGFAAGMRAVWRYVAAADQRVAESEEGGNSPPPIDSSAGGTGSP